MEDSGWGGRSGRDGCVCGVCAGEAVVVVDRMGRCIFSRNGV